MHGLTRRRIKVVPATLTCLVVMFVAPLLLIVVTPHESAPAALAGSEDWLRAFLRSVAFALTSVTLEISIGFGCAVLLRQVSKPMRRLLVALMLPALLGSVTLAFLVKLIMIRFPAAAHMVSERALLPTWLLMLVVELWQYSSLVTFLLWLQLQTIPKDVITFATSLRLTSFERVRDIYWPHCKNLVNLLTVIVMLQALHESTKFQLILRASKGTGLELAGHRLLRYYLSLCPASATMAAEETLRYCALFIAVSVATVVVALLIVDQGARILFTILTWVPIKVEMPIGLKNLVAIGLISISLLPLGVLVPYGLRANFIDLRLLMDSVGAALLVVGVTIIASVAFGISLRMGYPRNSQRFNRRSLVFLVGLFSVLIVPPIGIALLGLWWLTVAGSGLNSPPAVFVLWLLGQTVLLFPVLASFVFCTHFRVKQLELDFQEVVGANVSDIAKLSFFRRFVTDYLLIALFGFSIAWNEGTLNAILSGLFPGPPTIAVELTKRVEGRTNAYFEATNLILASLLPMVCAVVCFAWRKEQSMFDCGDHD